MTMPALDATVAYQSLQAHYAQAQTYSLPQLFSEDPQRFTRFSIEAANLLLDFSKNHLTEKTVELLCALARERCIEEQREQLFAGVKINTTERRAALHTALRAPYDQPIWVDGKNVTPDVHTVLQRIEHFSERVRNQQWRGYSGKPITDVVNIGIGGSHLGPQMACQALRSFSHSGLTLHFVSNLDGHDLDAVLNRVQSETTLFIIASKTFTTLETMTNAHSARAWFLAQATLADLPHHFVAVSTNAEAVQAFGIDQDAMFPFWDWVGGRYSLWSAIGLPIALAIGFNNFQQLLAGAQAMDQHFCTAPLEQNMPVILALLGLWNRNFFGRSSLSIAPYHHDLRYLASYLQQLEMESNGKSITIDGCVLTVASCPVIWGDVGTNGQHAYFQLLHQGTDVIPVDFIVALKPAHNLPHHHAGLIANCFAQSEALMRGKTHAQVRAELQAQCLSESEIDALLPHKVFAGNRPSNTILMPALTPATLGALIALYEHKVFVQGALWGINSFDQWGVELGKALAKNIQTELTGTPRPAEHDSSTNGLIARFRAAWN